MVGKGNVNQKLFECRLFCPLFALYRAKCGCADISYKKEEDSFNFGHETGFKLQKPGRKTSAYIFIFLSGSFWAHWRLFSKISVLFEVPVFSKVVSITS